MTWRREWAQGHVMTNFAELIPVPSDRLVPVADRLGLAVAAYLARFKAASEQIAPFVERLQTGEHVA